MRACRRQAQNTPTVPQNVRLARGASVLSVGLQSLLECSYLAESLQVLEVGSTEEDIQD